MVVRGSSLGGAAAAFAAAELHERVDGWILESLYLDLPTAVHLRTARRLPPGLDRLAARGLLTVAPLFLGAPVGDHDVRAALAAWRAVDPSAPMLVLTGDTDPLAPVAEARVLAAAAGADLWVVPGGGHEGLHRPDGEAYGARLAGLVARAEAHAQSAGTDAPSRARPTPTGDDQEQRR